MKIKIKLIGQLSPFEYRLSLPISLLNFDEVKCSIRGNRTI